MSKQTELAPNLLISASPFIRDSKKTSTLMRDVLIALVPVIIAATLIFGTRTLLMLAVAIVTAVLTEFVAQKLMHRRQTIGDLSAVVTAVLLVLNLPVEFPIWQLILGTIFAIAIVKQVFGGIGQNFVNPAVTARVALVASFAGSFAINSRPVNWVLEALGNGADAASSASPLATMARGVEGLANAPDLSHMFWGAHDTLAIGETSMIALGLGLIYLLVRKVIKIHIPLAVLGTVALCAFFFGQFNLDFVLYQLMSGGIVFVAIFMATDYATSPLTNKGKIIFGIGVGLITCIIRFWGSLPEGASYALIIMNIFTPHIDRWTVRRVFGKEEPSKKLHSLEEAE